ncbi:Smad nuclear-interacting 1 [Paramuricea clavata]|uniref:Smad nuclear-interacting 1 n=1 Tax=Paramuricea clavata TaxID=317549 RepID=A0A7D9HMI3_PARCT|nr:Smad nuclear-interacting 1 [Paramuricea clavata]
MSSRHRDRQRERRGRSRSPNGEQRDRKHGRHERSQKKSTSNRDGEKREERRRQENDRRNGEERRAAHGSPERKRQRQNTSYRDGEKREERQRQENNRRNGEELRVAHGSPERKRQQQNMDIENVEEGVSQTKEEPNFELSGKLTEYTNTYKGVVIKYNEPPEALKPKTRWRLYPFKEDKGMSVMYIHRQSAYLIGRQRHIVDLAVDHPSCSKQHAVLQYRLVNYEREDGTAGRKCKPYIIDLESANGTFLNNQKIEARRYYELKEKDVLKFGFSTREYVLLNEKSKVSEADEDDISEEAET